ncbi:MAG: DUF1015 domain-containing protein, partial [Frankiaceae bacterium]|nr:DUF1015 domain-containing protein [Frankiaceae bacterium]
LSPPYDVINPAARAALLAGSAENIVRLILPQGPDGQPDYLAARARLADQLARGVLRVDHAPALYVYELATESGDLTRGLLGALELRPPEDGVIFPHEDVMAGPVADRLALMEATEANLEPIYLMYTGGGAASMVVAEATQGPALCSATTADGIRHRLWAVSDPVALAGVAADLASRTAVIVDGHHRYATYLELQARRRASHGPGPWDRGLTMLVDATMFGPRVEAIHRVVPGLPLAAALERCAAFPAAPLAGDDLASGVAGAAERVLGAAGAGFAAILTDGVAAVLLGAPQDWLLDEVLGAPPRGPVESLDTTIVHRVLVQRCWGRADTADSLLYAHDAQEAIDMARGSGGVALLLRPAPVQSVLDVAQAGLRMPRKSTLFVPKPASGIVLRRFADG